jgi:O-antigen/teichoic acid export membrane protein
MSLRGPRHLPFTVAGPVRAVLTLVGGTGVAMAIVIASSPILTRLYLPSEYGVYSVALALLSILITITCMRYDAAIPLPERDATAADVLALALLVAVVVSLCTGAVLMVVGPSLLAVFGAMSLGPYVVLLAVGQLGGGVVSAFTWWAVRTRAFGEIAANRLAQSVALVAVQLGLGAGGLGATGLLVGDIAGRIAGSSRLARSAWHTHGDAIRQVTWRGVRSAASRYRRFPLLSMPSAVLNTFAMQLPLLLLVALFDADSGGRYALADRICSVPLTLVAGAVGQVYVAEIARLAHGSPDAVRAGFVRATSALARLALVPATLIAVLGPVLAGPVLGPGWSETGIYMAILSPMYYLTFIAAPTGETLNILERQDLLLVRELLRFALLGGAVPLAAALGARPIGAVIALSVAGCLTYGAYALFTWLAIITHGARARAGSVLDQPDPGPSSPGE